MIQLDLTQQDDSLSKRKLQANKPLMEKRRRARINKSLLELKKMLMDNFSTKDQTPGHSKWEKADILEMTVQYINHLKHRKQARKIDPLAIGQFMAGFSDCIRQIQKFSATDLDSGVRADLTEYLLAYLSQRTDQVTKELHDVTADESNTTTSKMPKEVSSSRSQTQSPSSSACHSPKTTCSSPVSSNNDTCSNSSHTLDNHYQHHNLFTPQPELLRPPPYKNISGGQHPNLMHGAFTARNTSPFIAPNSDWSRTVALSGGHFWRPW